MSARVVCVGSPSGAKLLLYGSSTTRNPAPADYSIKNGGLTIALSDFASPALDLSAPPRALRLRGADAIVVAFSLSSRTEFENAVRTWVPEVHRVAPAVPILVVGTGSDKLAHPGTVASLELNGVTAVTQAEAEDAVRTSGASRYIVGIGSAVVEAIAAAVSQPGSQRAVPSIYQGRSSFDTTAVFTGGDPDAFVAVALRSVGTTMLELACEGSSFKPEEPSPFITGSEIGPNHACEAAVLRVLRGLDVVGSGITRVTLRFDCPEDLCVSQVIGYVQHMSTAAANDHTMFQEFFIKGGHVPCGAFDALSKNLRRITIGTFGFQDCEVDASSPQWGLVGRSAVRHLVLNGVVRSKTLVTGIASALGGGLLSSLTVTNCEFEDGDLTAIAEAGVEAQRFFPIEILDLAQNKLASFPASLAERCPKLATLKLGNNQLGSGTTWLDALMDLPHVFDELSSLDLSNNRLTRLSDRIFDAPGLRILDISGNSIYALPKSFVSGEWLGRIGKFFCAGNPVFDTLPRSVSGDLMRTCTFLQELEHGETVRRSIRIALVGNLGSGKTSLREALEGKTKRDRDESATGSGSGIVVSSLEVTGDRGHKLGPPQGPSLGNPCPLNVEIWDFPGAKHHRGGNAHFFTPDALYVAVFDMFSGLKDSAAGEGLRDATVQKICTRVEMQLRAVQASSAVSVNCFIVGTHADRCSEKAQLEVIAAVRTHLAACATTLGMPFPNVLGVVALCTTKYKAVKPFRTTLLAAVAHLAGAGKRLPNAYLELGEALRRIPATAFPVVPFAGLAAVAKGCGITTPTRVSTAAAVLQELGYFVAWGCDAKKYTADVYLCFAPSDAAAAKTVAAHLRARGLTVRYACAAGRGDAWEGAVTPAVAEAIAGATCFLALQTAESQACMGWQAEVFYARSIPRPPGTGRLHVLSGASQGGPDLLQQALESFRRHSAGTGSECPTEVLDRLAAAMEDCISSLASSTPTRVPHADLIVLDVGWICGVLARLSLSTPASLTKVGTLPPESLKLMFPEYPEWLLQQVALIGHEIGRIGPPDHTIFPSAFSGSPYFDGCGGSAKLAMLEAKANCLNPLFFRFAAALHQLIPGISPPGHVGVTFERITFELSFMPPETFGRFTVILLNEFNLAAGQNDSALFTAGDCLLRLDVKGKRISLTVTSARSSSAAVVLDFARVMIETDLSAKYPGLGIRVAETTMRLAEGTAVGACSPWSSVASKNAALAPPRIVNDTSDPSCTSVFVIHAHSDMHHRESLVKHLDGDGYSVATAVPRRHEHGAIASASAVVAVLSRMGLADAVVKRQVELAHRLGIAVVAVSAEPGVSLNSLVMAEQTQATFGRWLADATWIDGDLASAPKRVHRAIVELTSQLDRWHMYGFGPEPASEGNDRMGALVLHPPEDLRHAARLASDFEATGVDGWIQLSAGSNRYDALVAARFTSCNVVVIAAAEYPISSRRCLEQICYAGAVGKPLIVIAPNEFADDFPAVSTAEGAPAHILIRAAEIMKAATVCASATEAHRHLSFLTKRPPASLAAEKRSVNDSTFAAAFAGLDDSVGSERSLAGMASPTVLPLPESSVAPATPFVIPTIAKADEPYESRKERKNRYKAQQVKALGGRMAVGRNPSPLPEVVIPRVATKSQLGLTPAPSKLDERRMLRDANSTVKTDITATRNVDDASDSSRTSAQASNISPRPSIAEQADGVSSDDSAAKRNDHVPSAPSPTAASVALGAAFADLSALSDSSVSVSTPPEESEAESATAIAVNAAFADLSAFDDSIASAAVSPAGTTTDPSLHFGADVGGLNDSSSSSKRLSGQRYSPSFSEATTDTGNMSQVSEVSSGAPSSAPPSPPVNEAASTLSNSFLAKPVVVDQEAPITPTQMTFKERLQLAKDAEAGKSKAAVIRQVDTASLKTLDAVKAEIQKRKSVDVAREAARAAALEFDAMMGGLGDTSDLAPVHEKSLSTESRSREKGFAVERRGIPRFASPIDDCADASALEAAAAADFAARVAQAGLETQGNAAKECADEEAWIIRDIQEEEANMAPASSKEDIISHSSPAATDRDELTKCDEPAIKDTTHNRVNSVATRLSAYTAVCASENLPEQVQEAPRKRVASVSSKMTELIDMTADALGKGHKEPEVFAATLGQIRSNDLGQGTDVNLANLSIFKKMEPAKRDQQFETFAEAIRLNNVITDINLSNIGANDFFVEELADALIENRSVTVINLETNDFGGPGCTALAGMLRHNRTLRKLRLANQRKAMPTRAQQKLADAVAANGGVTVCSIDVRDPTVRETLQKALARNLDAERIARKTTANDPGVTTAKPAFKVVPRTDMRAASQSATPSNPIVSADGDDTSPSRKAAAASAAAARQRAEAMFGGISGAGPSNTVAPRALNAPPSRKCREWAPDAAESEESPQVEASRVQTARVAKVGFATSASTPKSTAVSTGETGRLSFEKIALSAPTPSKRKVTIVIARGMYTAGKPGQLSFDKGDRFRLLDDSSKWWYVKDITGAKGKVPSNYVRHLTDNELTAIAAEEEEAAADSAKELADAAKRKAKKAAAVRRFSEALDSKRLAEEVVVVSKDRGYQARDTELALIDEARKASAAGNSHVASVLASVANVPPAMVVMRSETLANRGRTINASYRSKKANVSFDDDEDAAWAEAEAELEASGLDSAMLADQICAEDSDKTDKCSQPLSENPPSLENEIEALTETTTFSASEINGTDKPENAIVGAEAGDILTEELQLKALPEEEARVVERVQESAEADTEKACAEPHICRQQEKDRAAEEYLAAERQIAAERAESRRRSALTQKANASDGAAIEDSPPDSLAAQRAARRNRTPDSLTTSTPLRKPARARSSPTKKMPLQNCVDSQAIRRVAAADAKVTNAENAIAEYKLQRQRRRAAMNAGK